MIDKEIRKEFKKLPPTERIDRIEDLLLRGEITLDQARELVGVPARGDGDYLLQPIEATEAEGEGEGE